MAKDMLEKGAIAQRDGKTFAIAPHIAGGIIDVAGLRKIADIAEKYNAQALKLTSAQRIAIVGIKPEDLDNLWADLQMKPAHVYVSGVISIYTIIIIIMYNERSDIFKINHHSHSPSARICFLTFNKIRYYFPQYTYRLPYGLNDSGTSFVNFPPMTSSKLNPKYSQYSLR